MRCASAVFVIGLWVSASGCFSHKGFREQYQKARQDLLKGNWAGAVEMFVASKNLYSDRDRVMYWLNLGTLQHYAGQWSASQRNFVRAEASIQDLYTKSITAEASKYTITENLAPYEGEDFEKILLYYYTALNNVQQGNVSDAIVEARRADEFLKKIRVRYDEDDDLSTLYKQDAFMLWLVGLFYELEGSHNDAFAAYRRAFSVYSNEYKPLFRTPPPSFLAEDVVRSGLMANLDDEADDFGRVHRATGGTAALGKTQAEIIFIHAGGEAPFKAESFITAPMPDGYVARVALPKFMAPRPKIMQSLVEVSGKSVKTEMAEPISSIAIKNHKHQLPGLTARAIARATFKYAATKGTKAAVKGGKKSSKERKLAAALLGLAGNVAAVATENADLRGWTLLPAYFRVARIWVPAGHHTLNVRFMDRRGNAANKPRKIDVDLRPGERKIISIRTVQ